MIQRQIEFIWYSRDLLEWEMETYSFIQIFMNLYNECIFSYYIFFRFLHFFLPGSCFFSPISFGVLRKYFRAAWKNIEKTTHAPTLEACFKVVRRESGGNNLAVSVELEKNLPRGREVETPPGKAIKCELSYLALIRVVWHDELGREDWAPPQ